ncbi:hypothetical protein QQ045_024091 [Rhodiola kirilowii]
MRIGVGEDLFIWKGSNLRIFQLNSFDYLSKKIVYAPLGRSDMQNWIPSKISCFLWKIFLQVVPTEDNVRRAGVPIASRCVCCLVPSIESISHLFFDGDVGRLVRDFFIPCSKGLGFVEMVPLLNLSF